MQVIQITLNFGNLYQQNGFSQLHNLALKYCCRFGSTYVCEQMFSTMNIVKSKYRSKLTHTHLKHLILLACSRTNPNIDDLVKTLQIQQPH